jgi:uncharacterized protein
MPDGPVVANNTPLVALWTLGRLDLLRELFGEVLIPEVVQAEFLAIDRATRETALAAASWLRALPLAEPRHALAFLGLDEGEAAVLALAEERNARLVIMDERKGRRYAERMGFHLTGTVGLLLLAKEGGLIASVSKPLAELQGAGMHLSPLLITRALEIAGEEQDVPE